MYTVGNMQTGTVSSVWITSKVTDTTTGFKHLRIWEQTKEQAASKGVRRIGHARPFGLF
jgi:hypothetical protein